MSFTRILYCFLFFNTTISWCQNSVNPEDRGVSYQKKMIEAKEYKKQFLYSEAIKATSESLEYATSGDSIRTKLFRAELFRSTGDGQLAFEELWSIKDFDSDDEGIRSFRIRRFGRLAAVHHEFDITKYSKDSVVFYIDTAIVLSLIHI